MPGGYLPLAESNPTEVARRVDYRRETTRDPQPGVGVGSRRANRYKSRARISERMECNDCETELDTIVPKAKLMFRSVYECPDCGGRRLQRGAPDG